MHCSDLEDGGHFEEMFTRSAPKQMAGRLRDLPFALEAIKRSIYMYSVGAVLRIARGRPLTKFSSKSFRLM
jgi:hypothetical protein